MNQTKPGKKQGVRKTWAAKLLHVFLVLAISAAITFLAIYIQPNSIVKVAKIFLDQPLLILMNFLPAFFITVLLSSLTGNLFYGGALANAVVCGFSIASRIKCEIRQEPLYPRDLQLLREAGEALNSYDISLPWKIIGVVLLFSLVLAAVGFLVRRRGIKPGLRGLLRWMHALGSVVVALILVFVLYANHELYTSFEGTNFFKALGAYNDLGFPYSFCYYLTNNSVDKPEGFDELQAQQWDSAQTGDGEHLPVNVVIVMNESFTDIIDNEAFTYTPETDPIPFYHSMVAREDVLSGRLVVMNLGGGTANTEFDVMTGIRTESLSAATAVAFRTLSGNLDSIFREYGNAGYTTSYIHPGYAWFYNRNHILPWLGADTATFYEDLNEPDWLGGYIADDYTTKLLIDRFEKDTADGSLALNYTTTIQNHMNYTEEKYGEEHPIPALECIRSLDEETTTELSVYIEGLRYADQSLQKTVEYFESCGKPVLFVFFGDHYPYLGTEGSGYTQLQMDGDYKEYDFSLFAPPYFIWANDEAKEILDWESTMESLDMPEYMSAAYLGAALMEITGLSDDSPWFSYVNEMRREYPVVWQQEYMDSEGNILYALDGAGSEKMLKWRQWAYYRLQSKKITD